MPRVTVCLGSSRPGGIDVSLLGLAAQTYTDFEVILVDGRYSSRHAAVLDAVAASGLRQDFFHVPNHRMNPAKWGTTCAGMNTGFALAAGEIAIILCDYGYVRPDWLERHVAAHTEPRMVCAPHQYRGLPALKVGGTTMETVGMPADDVRAQRERFAEAGEISIFERTPTAEEIEALPIDGIEDTDGKHQKSSGPIESFYMHTKNESFPLKNVLDVGGMDENYDRGRGPGDPDLGRRLVASGLQSWLCREAGVLVLNPRKVMPNPNIALGEADVGERWGTATGQRYFDAMGSSAVANNPYDLRELRAAIWDWRVLSLFRDVRIPVPVVPDDEYFRDCPVRFP